MNPTTPICVIGAGHLGTSLLLKLADQGYTKLIATRRTVSALNRLQQDIPSLTVLANNILAVEQAKIIILATKQSSFSEIANEIKKVRTEKLLISLGPTYTIHKLTELFGKRIIRLMSPASPKTDIVCYTMDAYCTNDDEQAVRYIFGEHAKKLPENLMHIPTTYTLFRGVFNSFIDPLRAAGVNAGLDDKTARQLLGRMLVSAGKEIIDGVDAQQRLANASAGLQPDTFTMKLYADLAPAQDLLEKYFKKTCDTFKNAEE